MKRLLKSIIVFGFFAFPIVLNAQANYKISKSVTKDYNQVIIGVFPQVELISIVQTISKYPTAFGFLMAGDTSIYRTDVINHFDSYKNHPAVLMFNRLSLQPRMLNFSAPSNIMLYTNESLDLRTDIELDDFVINRAGGIDSLRVFLRLLRDFAVQSSFNDFFLDHRDFYLAITENTIKNMGSINYISELENFYGKTQKSYNIILVTLYNFVGFGNSLLYSNEKREIYNTMGPKTVLNNIPFFGDEKYLKYMIRHEFSHPFINPLTEKYWNYIKDYSHNYDSIPEVARKNVCGDWQECINEFIIRAITTQIAYNESVDIGYQAYKKEISRGVSYLDELMDRIKLYESRRDTFPTFESFYPTILDVLRK
jgi:hypothetical protein